jgi:hypothetical protein
MANNIHMKQIFLDWMNNELFIESIAVYTLGCKNLTPETGISFCFEHQDILKRISLQNTNTLLTLSSISTTY